MDIQQLYIKAFLCTGWVGMRILSEIIVELKELHNIEKHPAHVDDEIKMEEGMYFN